MRRWRWAAAVSFLVVLAGCGGSRGSGTPNVPRLTTAGAIAVANLHDQIARLGDEPEVVDLLLARSRFLGDHDVLARAVAIAEVRVATVDDYLRRARTRAAEHRFDEALTDVAAAERLGAGREEAGALRASILVATGRAWEALPRLEAEAAERPGFASLCALANAFAMIGRLADADSLYAAALADLSTTSPFPYAWVQLARGVMWAEQGADTVRAVRLYQSALIYLPEFAAANVHLAELEAASGDLPAALARLERVTATTSEPEALALLGALHQQAGDTSRARREIARARDRFEALLARHPIALADHAAEFYLGPGANADRAWLLAKRNLASRVTPQALALAVRAAAALQRKGHAVTEAQAADSIALPNELHLALDANFVRD